MYNDSSLCYWFKNRITFVRSCLLDGKFLWAIISVYFLPYVFRIRHSLATASKERILIKTTQYSLTLRCSFTVLVEASSSCTCASRYMCVSRNNVYVVQLFKMLVYTWGSLMDSAVLIWQISGKVSLALRTKLLRSLIRMMLLISTTINQNSWRKVYFI